VTQEELVQAFTEGRLSRPAFLRQLFDQGMSVPDALSYADELARTEPRPSEGSAAPPASESPKPMSEKPVQVRGLDINFVGDGYIVSQPDHDQMHSLNHTAAIVLELCTGQNDAAEIAHLLQEAYDLPSPPDMETRQCLATLLREGLIE
jgi:Coenzyme PQQ synthesis protein D (PqqD)